jgi:expansin (peptidoglycan-binding protein)
MNAFKLWFLLTLFGISNAFPQANRFTFTSTGGSGDATFYNSDGSGGTCSFDRSNDQLFAALPGPVWDNAGYCGACALVTGPLGSVTVKIVDKCPECLGGSLDLSTTAFNRIARADDGRVPITWKWVECSSNDKKLTYVWKEGSSAYWLGIQARDNIKPIKSLSLNGQVLQRQYYNYFIGSNMGPGPFTVKVEFTDGSVVEESGIQMNQVTKGSVSQSTSNSTPNNIQSQNQQLTRAGKCNAKY